MRFTGGKGQDGVYQRLINQIPPHRVFIESHLGGGAIMRSKRPAEVNLGIDVDFKVLRQWKEFKGLNLVQADAGGFLNSYPFKGDEFVYADPPYLISTLSSSRSPYSRGYSEKEHGELLKVLLGLPCMVMVSGYWSPLYADLLDGWRTIRYPLRTRSGETAEEWLWMNYPEPLALHDYQYLGDSFRERQRIQRRITRWRKRLEEMPPLEKAALLEALN